MAANFSMDFLESAAFTSLVTGLLKQNHIPGLAVAVVHNGQVASTGFGTGSFESNLPCTGDTLFDVASSAKSLTAASVALLVDDKKYPEVQYEAPMSRLLPDDFVMQDESYTKGVTVEDVLSHRTGMASHDSSYLGINAPHPDNAKSITRNLRNLKVAAPLRSRYLYCNQMFTVATHLVEETSKKGFSEYLAERIFQPLDMTSTTLQPASAKAKGWEDRMARGYIWENNDWRSFEAQDCPEGQGAGSIISSANDFIKWVKALLNREGPISDRVYQGLTKMRSIVNPNARRLRAHTTPANYTAGMEIYFYRGNMVVGHDGNIPGFSSRFIFMPDSNFGAVVLGNSAGAGGAATTIMRELMDEVLGVSIEDRPPQNNNKKKNTGPKIELPLRPKVQPQEPKDDSAKDQPVDKSKDQAQEQQIKTDTKPKPQDTAQASGKEKKKEKGKKEKNKGTQQPQTPKKQPQAKPQKRSKSPPPQTTPLDAYVGQYWNAGYHGMTVQIKDDQLFVDATDRAMGFTMTFEHVNDQTEYTAHIRDDIELGDDPVDAEFVFEDGKAVKMGLDLEPAIRELIWFERRDE